MRIAIVGAGPGGLFASIVLTDSGHDVVLFEQANARDDTGAGIQVSPNGTRLLAQYNVLEPLLPLAFEPQAAELRRADTGQIVFKTPLNSETDARYDAPYLHLHRADLAHTLYDEAVKRGVTIFSPSRIETFSITPDSVRIEADDDTHATFDLLIGADGIHSATRTHLFGKENARYTGHVAWRGLVPADHIDAGLIPPNATVWAGPGQHFVHYYVRGGELVNFVAVQKRTDWADENWQTPGDLDEVREAFHGWSDGITQILNGAETCHLWGLFDRPPLPRWTGPRVALLG